MPLKEKRLKQKAAVKDSILCAARSIVLNEGWQAVSIRKIAEVIGYSLPVVYKHFASKDAILEEFVKQGFTLLSELMLKTKLKSTEPDQQLTLMAIAYFDFAFTKREYYQMMFGLGMPSCEKANQIIEIGNFSNIIINTIELLITNESEHEKKILKFYTFWSIMHGLSAINMTNITTTPNEMQQRVLLDAIQGFIKNINN